MKKTLWLLLVLCILFGVYIYITSMSQTYTTTKELIAWSWSMANTGFFTIGGTSISFVSLVLSVVIFLLGMFIGKNYKKLVTQKIYTSSDVKHGSHTLVANIGYYVIVVISLAIALNFLGINLSSIAFIAGALSVGIGFGLQNIVSNFISGLILMFERSIKIGDYIELSSDLKGKVIDIRMRYTMITTNSNMDILVPNQSFIQNNVINWTMNDDICRFDVPFGVAYGTNPSKVIEVILEKINSADLEMVYTSPEKITRVIMTGMGESSVDFELNVWIKGEATLVPKRTTSVFLTLIYEALYESDISIPFPQMDIYVKELPRS
ncbi:MAG: mechanosensitive ion channel [Campylobacterales bacterium]|nr:mechanosensitive ion channel [Campylobacterales bacterium]